MGLPLRLFVTAAAAASARRLEEESCFDMVLTDSYADTWDGTTYTITDDALPWIYHKIKQNRKNQLASKKVGEPGRQA